jgi:hypothetical protein
MKRENAPWPRGPRFTQPKSPARGATPDRPKSPARGTTWG